MNLWVIFLTGLTTGGLSCLAMQGGLLASVIANQKRTEHQETSADHISRRLFAFDRLDWVPVLLFLGAKLFIHTIFGALLGMLGSTLQLSLEVRLFFQAFTAVFMFATAMNLLNVHPIFRYVVFQPPRWMQRVVKKTSMGNAFFTPVLLGLLTVVIPCGVTQAMEVLAINSGNALVGASIMFAFVLGTSPLFALLGVATAKMSEGWYRWFTRIAAGVLVVMALYGINGVLLVLDSPLTINRLVDVAKKSDETNINTQTSIQYVNIEVHNRGYNPRYIKVKKGIPVELTLKSNGAYSCALAFVFREYGINTFLKSVDTKVFTFTPTRTGKFTFACSMGMYTGTMEVL